MLNNIINIMDVITIFLDVLWFISILLFISTLIKIEGYTLFGYLKNKKEIDQMVKNRKEYERMKVYSDYLENIPEDEKENNNLPFVGDNSLFMGLLDEDGNEIAAEDYKRIELFPYQFKNGSNIAYLSFTAKSDWGKVGYFSLYDGLGTFILSGRLGVPGKMDESNIITFPPHGIRFAISNQ